MFSVAQFSLLIMVSLSLCNPANSKDYVDEMFGNDTATLVHYITKGDGAGLAYDWLSTLVDGFGHRMVGSDSLEEAIDYVVKGLEEENFDEVHTEDVPNLPHWVRDNDVVELIEPRQQRLNVLAIGGTVPADIIGEAVVIRDFKDLRHMNVSSKIVITAQLWRGYRTTVKYRRSIKMLQSLGAIGVLIKSVAPFSINSPHAGNGAEGAKIPAAALSLEEADMIYRLYRNGEKIVIRMSIKSHSENQTTTSRNVIFQITGRELPSEVVLLTAHLDSWDVGQGALDNGGGCAAVWNALFSLKQLIEKNAAFRPKRTIRGIFWTAEEQGYLGAQHYYNTHKDSSNETFYFVSETDQGAFKPGSWHSYLIFCGNEQQGDVHFWSDDGVPSVSYMPSKSLDYYFFFHHTNADYITIFQDGDLEYTAAIFAVLAHVIANMNDWGSEYESTEQITNLLNGFLVKP